MNQQRYAHALQNARRLAGPLGAVTRKCQHRAPCPDELPAKPARPWFLPADNPSMADARRRYRHSPGPCAASCHRARPAGTCATRRCRMDRATYPIPPWSRSPTHSAVRRKSLRRYFAEVLLGRPVRRPVVIGQVEVRHSAIEGAPDDRPPGLERRPRRQNSATNRATPGAKQSPTVHSAETAPHHTFLNPAHNSFPLISSWSSRVSPRGALLLPPHRFDPRTKYVTLWLWGWNSGPALNSHAQQPHAHRRCPSPETRAVVLLLLPPAAIAEPELVYPESSSLKLTRPSGSGDLA
jgi:hypothetical protein